MGLGLRAIRTRRSRYVKNHDGHVTPNPLAFGPLSLWFFRVRDSSGKTVRPKWGMLRLFAC